MRSAAVATFNDEQSPRAMWHAFGASSLAQQQLVEIDAGVVRALLNTPIVPDGAVGEQAFAVIREAVKQEGMVALGKVVFTLREHVISLEPRGKGLLGITLRYPYEVRKESEYFDDIPDEKIPKDMLELASHIVETKAGHFEPEKFEDQYEDALKELIRKKHAGKPIEQPERRESAKVINLMDALRRSVEAEKKPPAAREPSRRASASKSRRPSAKRSTGQQKAG